MSNTASRVKTSFKKERNYQPTTAELNEAIEDYLHEHPKATTGSVRSALITSQKTWVIPERRLKKFVKRQQAGKPMTADDDKSTISSISGFFSNMKSKQPAEAAPKKKKQPAGNTKPAATTVSKKPTTEPTVKDVKPKKADPVVPVEENKEEIVDKSAYADDNDGKKSSALDPCDGCTIL